jgi:hypothetical protein
MAFIQLRHQSSSIFVDKFMHLYNFIRPHGAFDIESLETPAVIFYQKLSKRRVIMDTTLLENIQGV